MILESAVQRFSQLVNNPEWTMQFDGDFNTMKQLLAMLVANDFGTFTPPFEGNYLALCYLKAVTGTFGVTNKWSRGGFSKCLQ